MEKYSAPPWALFEDTLQSFEDDYCNSIHYGYIDEESVFILADRDSVEQTLLAWTPDAACQKGESAALWTCSSPLLQLMVRSSSALIAKTVLAVAHGLVPAAAIIVRLYPKAFDLVMAPHILSAGYHTAVPRWSTSHPCLSLLVGLRNIQGVGGSAVCRLSVCGGSQSELRGEARGNYPVPEKDDSYGEARLFFKREYGLSSFVASGSSSRGRYLRERRDGTNEGRPLGVMGVYDVLAAGSFQVNTKICYTKHGSASGLAAKCNHKSQYRCEMRSCQHCLFMLKASFIRARFTWSSFEYAIFVLSVPALRPRIHGTVPPSALSRYNTKTFMRILITSSR
ncbi:hypothetical protein K490DRAFT_58957 [Saccharata proteae CBS 121410]|uniref:Uncharacterized protein n=1 Tax=Saccharata proteae CBS 121410 TaxID=1314787 RepID=A0A9P4HT20_9PEZI|nr:hypothetical protein K490DRAFT_58957 [Saccharata proteae CBS 121410]